MCSMCHHCGAEAAKSGDDKRKLEDEKPLKSDSERPDWSCRFCHEKRDGVSPSASPMISPTTSLSSSDRSISSCSELSVDVNSYERCQLEGGKTHCAPEDLSYGLNGKLQSSSSEAPVNRVDRFYKVMEDNMKDSHGASDIGDTVRDVEIVESISNQEAKDHFREDNVESLIEGNESSHFVDSEIEAQVWEPPEAEDPEDDLGSSVAFNDDDDDDECGDGTKWGKPSSLSCWRDEGSRSFRLKEEKQKAMEEVKNGKFKAFVNHVLKTEGVALSGKDGANWVDIVTSLSWEAASFLKPGAIDGKATDLNAFVKVKCIAAGVRSESQIVRGLVFKKHAAHKHMQTNYKNPRLLLIQGTLGQSSSGLASLKAMEQEERDNLKSLVEIIETCHPNVILVEKSVSRDVQESIVAKGMTLVYDMKLHRLQRISRCTGSPILSSETLISQKLKHCDSFQIERFVEEHAGLAEGGKKPSKTLMFIEGCPSHLGCTILLKGSHSDELKRVKYAVQKAVYEAYQLIIETSYLVDVKTTFSTIPFPGILNISPRGQQSSALESSNSETPCFEQSSHEIGKLSPGVSVSHGLQEGDFHSLQLGLHNNSSFSHVPYNPAVFTGFSSLSSSLKKVIGTNFPLTSSVPNWSLSNYFRFSGEETDVHIISEDDPVSESLNTFGNGDIEAKGDSDKEKLLDVRPQSLLSSSEVTMDKEQDGYSNEDQVQSNDLKAVLDPHSILVLMSRRNALKGTICEQSHFSHIMFYRNFDVPLGMFLLNLLNQRGLCTNCGELPEAHIYYYSHHNKQLTIRVKRTQKLLAGEAEGKLWMWVRCSKCKRENGALKSTKRVLVSTAARSLSFGKFLELSFSPRSSPGSSSSCGHSPERDFLYFFGLGPMAAMFKYSAVTTYGVALPPEKLEFINSIGHDVLKREVHDLFLRGVSLFGGVGDILKKLKPQLAGSTLNLQGSLKEFSDIEGMLAKESSDFEANQVGIQNAFAKADNKDESGHKFLRLNWSLWELLLEACIWEKRLHSLLLPDPSVVRTGSIAKAVHDQFKSEVNGISDGRNEKAENSLVTDENVADDSEKLNDMLDTSGGENEFSIRDIPVGSPTQDPSEQDSLHSSTSLSDDSEISSDGDLSHHGLANPELFVKTSGSDPHHHEDGNFEAGIVLPDDLQDERNIPITTDVDSDASSRKGTSPSSLVSNLENSKGWFWMPFSEIRRIYIKDLQLGLIPKFSLTNGYIQDAAYQLITEESSRLHIPLGSDNYVVRDYDGELSSIIACALAFLKDQTVSTEVLEENARKEGGISANSTDNSHNLARIPSKISPRWSSTGSDSDSVQSTLSISSEDSRFSSFDGLNLLESLVSPENLSPEVSLGVTKSLAKGKYSVICLYAKQFRDLRNRCCPSELDYIASLSRCKNWDAKGGKSKSFFAKTLDDRFIIKEIKRTEFESFVQFAPDYFKYMNESFDLGNQTCLAKVLGIYQVIIRQTKGGKEMKHDLMVMENLTFGRNITRLYDLKGALHARYSSASDGSGDVLLDQNFVNDMNSSPLYVSNRAKRLLERAVWNDTTFLNSINVMDYSLLVGVDSQRHELVCGIIDYLRQYTWDKQLETWVKSSLVVPKNVLPTVISPREYKKRFRKFMSTHFLSVPDNWCSEKSSDACELCGISTDESSKSKSHKQGGPNGFSQ
ncbi:hypothetical protein Tsubulata_016727 [Turnera subulata]|uniref:1-phosphatidylinositol-3-phosphate 5-kinase n=1 Tax=Turnera subulata TaxID=218843 RepID=A0A9Q0JLJ9_9ROSI|nr:hypothetical protein Tsubulata_016727 [Turnera subulata]